MKVWMIRSGALAEILDIVTSSNADTADEVIAAWRGTYLGSLYRGQYPNALASLAENMTNLIATFSPVSE